MRKYFYILLLSFLVTSNSFAGWFDKNKIKVSKCYDTKKYKSYRDQTKKVGKSGWEAEINLKQDTVVISIVHSGKVSMTKTGINMKTDRFVGTYPEVTHDIIYLFDLKKEAVTTRLGPRWSDKDAKLMGGRESILKCKFS